MNHEQVFLVGESHLGTRIRARHVGDAVALETGHGKAWTAVGAVDKVRSLTLLHADKAILSLPTLGASRLTHDAKAIRFDLWVRSLLVDETLPLKLTGGLQAGQGGVRCLGWKLTVDNALHRPFAGSFRDLDLADLAGASVIETYVGWRPDTRPKSATSDRLGILFPGDERFLAQLIRESLDSPRLLRLGRRLNGFGVPTQFGKVPPQGTHLLFVQTLHPPVGSEVPRHELRLEFTPKSPAPLLQGWNQRVAGPILSAQRTAKHGSEISFVPCFENIKDGTWCVEWQVEDRAGNLSKIEADGVILVPTLESPGSQDKVLIRAPATLQPVKVTATASLPGVLTHRGTPLRFELAMGKTTIPLTVPAAMAFSATFGSGATHAGDQTVRIGSLDLKIGGRFAGKNAADAVSQVAAVLKKSVNVCAGPDERPELLAKINLPVMTVAPGGQDDTTTEDPAPTVDATEPLDGQTDARERPIVALIAMAKEAEEQQAAAFRMHAEERNDRSARELALELIDIRQNGARSEERSRVVVMDRTPFLVAEVSVPVLQAKTADQEITQIANWSSRGAGGAGWEILSDEVSIRLPPQGIGEQYERRSGEGIELDGRSQARFSPPAGVELSASLNRQRYVEAPWNLRRLLGVAGQRTPGAPLRRLEFELLYGFHTEVQSPRLMLTELLARIGAPAGKLNEWLAWIGTRAQKDRYEEFRTGWQKISSQLASRLALLEVWSTREPDLPLELTTGVRNVIRKSADLRHPIVGETAPAEGPDPKIADGLAGGVSWGFESKNVYGATLRRPHSVAAELRRPFLSSLGGWGWQKGVFDEGRQAIYADVAMGRVFFYALERLGRVGVLWNRAKHVITYERQVAPSLQFGGTQEWHLGRPIVRKVREYVELLQPERSYPDDASPPQATGMLLGSCFATSKIAVDSAWGSDVGDSGWQVPLWKTGQDPRVYVKPSIRLVVAAAPESGSPSLEVEVDEPEKLVFYTDTREGTGADTDVWASIPGVDFVDLPIPRPADEDEHGERHALPIPTPAKGKPDPQFPGVPAREPGYDRFTWALVPSDRGANLVGRRATGSVEAVLGNLTMQRAAAVSTTNKSLLGQLIEDARTELTAKLGREQARILDFVSSGNLKGAEDLLKELRDELPVNARGLAKRLKTELCRDLEAKINDELKQAVARVFAEVEKNLRAPLDLSVAQAALVLEEVRDTLDAAGASAHELADRLGDCSTTTRKELEDLHKQLAAAFASVQAQVRTRLTALEGDALTPLNASRQRLLGLLGRASGYVDQARRALDRAREDFDKPFERTLELIEAALVATGELPKLQAALKDVAERLETWAPGLPGATPELRAKVQELKAALYVLAQASTPEELERAAGLARGALSQLRRQLHAVIDALLKPVVDASGLIDGLKSKVDVASANATEALRRMLTRFVEETSATVDVAAGTALDEFWKLIERISGSIPPDLCRRLEHVCRRLGGTVSEEERSGARGAASIVADAATELGKAQADLNAAFDAVEMQTDDWVRTQVPILAEKICQAVEAALEALVERILDALDEVKAALKASLETLKIALGRLGDEVADTAGKVLESAAEYARRLGLQDFQIGDPGLRLLRAWGEAPRVPGLDFSLPRLGYFFHDIKGLSLPHVDISAATALVNRIGESLRGMGLRLPTLQLGDRLLPDSLDKYDLAKIFPDFGGMRLDGLFPGLSLPKIASDRIKVTHGIDKESRRAWVQADIDVPYDQRVDVLPFDPLNVRLAKARFKARQRAEGGLDGDVSSRTWAQLASTWEIEFAGLLIVRLVDTTLTHQDGRTRFHVDPSKVELPGAMQFLTDLLERTGLADTGLTVRVLPGSPPGLESKLLLPLPDVTLGAFSIYNLQLLSTLTLGFEDGDFFVETRFALGDRERPFALAVTILAGGGYVELGARYTPATGKLIASTRIGIAAGAALAFNFGPIRGGIWLLFALEVEWSSAKGGGLSIALLIILRGEAQVFGFISVSLSLVLEGRYRSDGSITATGRLKIKVKVGRFFKKTVRVRVRYQLAGKSTDGQGDALLASAAAKPDPFKTAAEHYIGMLAG